MVILSFTAKCSDCFGMTISDDATDEYIRFNGYVPYDIGIGGGDYVEIKIDIETGEIINWDPKKIEHYINNYKKDV